MNAINNVNIFFMQAWAIAHAEFKLRNEGSFLGILWYLLNPLLFFGLLLLVFSYKFGSTIKQYPLYLLLGIIMFNFFQFITIESTQTMRMNKHLLRAIPITPKTLTAAIVLKFLFSHLFEMIIFYVLLLYFGIPWYTIGYYICTLFLFCVFCYGCSLILSVLTIFCVDLEHIWVFLSRLLWFATPIFYRIENEPQLTYLSYANPLYFFITTAREMVIYNHLPEVTIITGCLSYTIGIVIIGILVQGQFRRTYIERL